MNIVKAKFQKVGFRTLVTAGTNSIICDIPEIKGGENKGFSPKDLLCGAIASSTSIYLKRYAHENQIELSHLEVYVYLEEGPEDKSMVLKQSIHFNSDLSEDMKNHLLDVCANSPIHQFLMADIVIETANVENL